MSVSMMLAQYARSTVDQRDSTGLSRCRQSLLLGPVIKFPIIMLHTHITSLAAVQGIIIS